MTITYKLAMTLAVFCLGAAPEASAQAPEGKPSWAQLPSGADVVRRYPDAAQRAQLGGQTVVRCRVTAEHKLSDCEVLVEEPEGYGFGQAALGLSTLFRVKPLNTEGRPIENQMVTVPVTWMLPDGRPPPPRSHEVGGPAWLIKPAARASDQTIACPSPKSPTRACHAYPFVWVARPTNAQALHLLRKAARRAGVSTMECAVAGGGALRDCVTNGESSEVEGSAMLELASFFRAPEKTTDGTSTRQGRVLVSFHWAPLMKVADVTPTAPARP